MDLEGFHTGSDVVDLGENIDLTGMALKTIFSHGCGLASTIVSQKGNHLVLMQVKAQFVEGQFAACFVNFGKFVNADDQRQVARLLLDASHLL